MLKEKFESDDEISKSKQNSKKRSYNYIKQNDFGNSLLLHSC